MAGTTKTRTGRPKGRPPTRTPKREEEAHPELPVARSQRGRRAHEEQVLGPMEQIRNQPHGVTGAWCYYLRPDGATIRDALILSPNGGVPDENAVPNARLRAAYATNSDVFRARARRKGFIPLGQQLTEGAMEQLVKVLKTNKDDEVLFLEDEIAMCDYNIATVSNPKDRDEQRRRRRDFERRLHYVLEELDPDAMEAELKEIAQAQQLRNIDPAVLRVMRTMIGEAKASVLAKLAVVQRGKTNEEEPVGARGTPIKDSSGATGFDATGKDFVDLD